MLFLDVSLAFGSVVSWFWVIWLVQLFIIHMVNYVIKLCNKIDHVRIILSYWLMFCNVFFTKYCQCLISNLENKLILRFTISFYRLKNVFTIWDIINHHVMISFSSGILLTNYKWPRMALQVMFDLQLLVYNYIFYTYHLLGKLLNF